MRKGKSSRKVQTRFKVNGTTFKGSKTSIFSFASLSNWDQILKKDFALLGHILSLNGRPYFGWASLSKEANRKSRNLLLFVKLMKKSSIVMGVLQSTFLLIQCEPKTRPNFPNTPHYIAKLNPDRVFAKLILQPFSNSHMRICMS